MLFDDGELNGEKSAMTDENQRKLEEVVELISIKSFSNPFFRDDRIISKGKSIFDVIQDKIIEFLQRNRKLEADPEADSKWFDERVDQGKRKLYKTAENIDSLDDYEDSAHECLARDERIQSNLEKYQILQNILRGYDAKKKLIVELRFYRELEYSEVAEKVGTTEGNVRKIICQFRKDCGKSGIATGKSRRDKKIGDENDD